MNSDKKEETSLDMDLMRLGVDYHAHVFLRGKRYRVRPLSSKEILESNEEVVDYFSKKNPELRIGLNEALVISQIRLEKASTSKPGTFDPCLPMLFLESLTTEEINYLWKQYVAICNRANPEFEEMSTEELLELVEKVKKSPERSMLIDLSFYNLVDVCLHFVKESQK